MGDLIRQLGIGWFQLLVYAINLAIILVIFRILLYKPIKKMLDDRKARLQEIYHENQRLNQEALEQKRNYEKMLNDAKQEVAKISDDAMKKAQARGDEIVRQATLHAEDIVSGAMHEIEAEKARLQKDFEVEIAEIALDVAGKLLEREVSKKDNQKLIEECLEQWEH